MTRVPVGDALESVAGTDETPLHRRWRPTNWKATGPPFGAKPAGSVMVGLPVMSNGQVKRSKPAISDGVFAERRHLGERRRSEGLGRHGDEIDRLEQRRTAPRNASRRSTIF